MNRALDRRLEEVERLIALTPWEGFKVEPLAIPTFETVTDAALEAGLEFVATALEEAEREEKRLARAEKREEAKRKKAEEERKAREVAELERQRQELEPDSEPEPESDEPRRAPWADPPLPGSAPLPYQRPARVQWLRDLPMTEPKNYKKRGIRVVPYRR